MECDQVKREDIIEKYLTARLSSADQEAFEEHYFGCAHCFDELETYRALQAQLGEAKAEIRSKPLRAPVVWRWAWAAGIAVVVLAFGLAMWLRPPAPGVQPRPPVAVAPTPEVPAQVPETQVPAGPEVPQPAPLPPPVPSLRELARVEPPLYISVTLRGAVDEATERFHEAMKHYVAGDYGAALPGLRVASELNPKAANISFFLAICQLLTDQTDTAIAGLQETVALGDSPYLEEAHFYLAKAWLRQGDLRGTQDELKKTIQLQGKLEGEARQLLEQLQAISVSRDSPQGK